MDLNTIALWLGAVLAGSLFLRSARAPHRPVGWLVVTGAILLCAGLGWLWFPDSVGLVVGPLALVTILLPTWLHNAGIRASRQSRYPRARSLLRVASWLHPFDNWRSTPRIFEAFELAHLGRVDDAVALLGLLAQGEGQVALVAEAHRLRLQRRWLELKVLAERNGLLALQREPSLFALYLRALGELGELDKLADFMRAQEATVIGLGAFDVAILYLFAFSGQVELARQAVAAARPAFEESDRALWVALAAEHAGDVELARQLFGRLRGAADAQARQHAERHIEQLRRAAPVAIPSPRVLETITHFARMAAQRRDLIPNSPGRQTARAVTTTLIVMNVLIYFWGSFPGLRETRDDFIARWAFNAKKIAAGEYWRLLSYLFSHGNAIHVGMNMAGLWALGPFVERAFGRLRFCVIYLFSGCAGSAVYLILYQAHVKAADDLVGASGCLMGLLGATAAVMVRAWFRERAAIAGQLFWRLLAVIALQVWFDSRTPEVAGLAHMVGLAGGFLAGLVLRERVSSRESIASLA